MIKYQLSLNRWILAPAFYGLGLTAIVVGQVTLSNVMPADFFGLYVLIYNSAAIFSALGSAGFDLSAVRYIALAKKNNDTNYIIEMLFLALPWVIGFTITSTLIFTLYLIINGIISTEILYLTGGITVFWSLSRLINGFNRGLGFLAGPIFFDRALRDFLVMLIALIALYYYQPLASIKNILITLLIGNILGAFFGCTMLYRANALMSINETISSLSPLNNLERKNIIYVSIGLLLYNIIELFSSRFDIFVLSFFVSKEVLGTFGITLLLINLVVIPSIFLAMVVMPMVSEAHNNKDDQRLRTIFNFMTCGALFFGVGISLIFFFTARNFDYLLPSQFLHHIDFELIALALFLRSFSLVGAFPPVLLMMSGRIKALIFSNLPGLLFRILIYFGFSVVININIAVIAYVVSTLIAAIINLYLVKYLFFSKV